MPTTDIIWCPPIDIDAEDLVPALDTSHYPGRPSKSAAQRWIRNGIIDKVTGRRKRLAVVQQGGRVFTSLQAIRRFNAGPGASAVSQSQKKVRAQAAMIALEAAGV